MKLTEETAMHEEKLKKCLNRLNICQKIGNKSKKSRGKKNKSRDSKKKIRKLNKTQEDDSDEEYELGNDRCNIFRLQQIRNFGLY